MHLLAASAVQIVVQGALESGALPRENDTVQFILRMMQLAVDSRQMLRDRKYMFPEADSRVEGVVLPLLGALALEYEIIGSPPPQEMKGELEYSHDLEAAFDAAAKALPKSEVARKLLQRQKHCPRVKLLGSCSRCVAAESFDFAATLASRLAELVKAKQLHPVSALWRYAVDNVLVRAVDSHTQEVLRLLLAVAPHLAPNELGTYLKLTLDHSRRSRKRSGKKMLHLQQHGMLDPLSDFPMSMDIGSDGWPGILSLKHRSADGVKSMYSQFKSIKGMDASSAPHLFAYLDESVPQSKAAEGGAAPGEAGPSGDAAQGGEAAGAGDMA
eukprot:gene29128-32346_t